MVGELEETENCLMFGAGRRMEDGEMETRMPSDMQKLSVLLIPVQERSGMGSWP